MQLITSLWYGGQENENTGQVQQRSEIDKEKNTESQEVQGTFPLNTQQCLTIAANSFKSDSNSGIPSQLGKMSKR
jgi:hypothetical protein